MNKTLSSNMTDKNQSYSSQKKIEKRRKTLQSMRRHWFLYLIVAFPILYVIIFKYVPMIGIQIAFKNYRVVDGIFGSPWVGFEHFETFFNYPGCWDIIRNTFVVSIYGLIVSFPAAIILALMINEVSHTLFKKSVQFITYAPYFISTVVMVAMLLDFTHLRGGLINEFIGLFGIEPINFFGIAEWFPTLYVFSGVWQTTGYASIIYIAALSGVDPTLYEAARIDGASRMQKLIYIDIPSILPTAIILLIVNVGQTMNVGFEKVFLMQTPLNMDTAEVIATYSYSVAMESGQFSYSTAISLFNSIINMTLLLVVNKIARKTSETSLW